MTITFLLIIQKMISSHFLTKEKETRQFHHSMYGPHFYGTLKESDRVDDNTTHLIFHQGVGFKSGLESLNLTSLQDTVSTVTTDWLSDCIAARNLIPTTEFEVS